MKLKLQLQSFCFMDIAKCHIINYNWAVAPDTHNAAVPMQKAESDLEIYFQIFIWLTMLK